MARLATISLHSLWRPLCRRLQTPPRPEHSFFNSSHQAPALLIKNISFLTGRPSRSTAPCLHWWARTRLTNSSHSRVALATIGATLPAERHHVTKKNRFCFLTKMILTFKKHKVSAVVDSASLFTSYGAQLSCLFEWPKYSSAQGTKACHC